MEEIYTYGGLKSPEDYRDIPFSALGAAVPLEPLPDHYFIDISKLPVWVQKKIPACVGFASAKSEQEDYLSNKNEILNLSPRFVFAVAKSTDGMPKEYGTYYRMGVKILEKYGCATEAAVPNDTNLTTDEYTYNQDLKQIPQAAFDEALKYKIPGYAQVSVSDESDLKRAIMNSQGVILGLNLDHRWSSSEMTDPSHLSPPYGNPSPYGHDLYCYGFDTFNGITRFWILNSWGKEWGQNGTGAFLYPEYQPFLTEAWAILPIPKDWFDHAKTLPPPDSFTHNFNQDMKHGESSDEVKNLQIALKILGFFPKDQMVTGFYGDITAKSVVQFQLKYITGFFNKIMIYLYRGKYCREKTRGALNVLFNKS